MDINIILNYFSRYGLIFLFVIVFIEYLNFPGVPATIVLPTIGAFVAQTKNNLILVILISIVAAICGSIVFYIVGYYIGTPILECLNKNIPKTKKYIEKILSYSDRYGNKAILICRLIPVIRTLISLISGVLKSEFIGFVLYSAVGIGIWNTAFISLGYFAVKTLIP